MFSGLGLGNILGSPTGYSSGGGIANAYNPYAQQAGWNQASAAAYNQLTSIHARQHQPSPWRFQGQDMTFEEFVEAIFPEDCPQKTFFVLKYKK